MLTYSSDFHYRKQQKTDGQCEVTLVSKNAFYLSELAGQTGWLVNGMGHFEGIVPQNFQTWTLRKCYALFEEFQRTNVITRSSNLCIPFVNYQVWPAS